MSMFLVKHSWNRKHHSSIWTSSSHHLHCCCHHGHDDHYQNGHHHHHDESQWACGCIWQWESGPEPRMDIIANIGNLIIIIIIKVVKIYIMMQHRSLLFLAMLVAPHFTLVRKRVSEWLGCSFWISPPWTRKVYVSKINCVFHFSKGSFLEFPIRLREVVARLLTVCQMPWNYFCYSSALNSLCLGQPIFIFHHHHRRPCFHNLPDNVFFSNNINLQNYKVKG